MRKDEITDRRIVAITGVRLDRKAAVLYQFLLWRLRSCDSEVLRHPTEVTG
jgi:hypothetical protein